MPDLVVKNISLFNTNQANVCRLPVHSQELEQSLKYVYS